MTAETDLPVLLATMRPQRRPGSYVFVLAPAEPVALPL